ncbi:phosphate ABC transporter permease PstA [Campylobacter sp. RM16192]|uniref:phosphate ABC transporter permease PstA n=1 Tax=Campylobacter sp. RM16192 TaxID=1660080 RepID=UPI001451C4F8|nr:phosphate ABC transporter permease PstA [Campylobacter sp. RM16192]QCD52005.1 phosphate ABC transporter, permease protein [Campylobacter sp. RM16192]
MIGLISKETLKTRRLKSKIFKLVSMSSFVFCVIFLAFFLFSLISSGIGEFKRYYINVDILITEKLIQNPYSLPNVEKKYISRAWLRNLPNLIKQEDINIGETKSFLATANADVDGFLKHNFTKLNGEEIKEVMKLQKQGIIVSKFNKDFFTRGDSKIPENAGFLSAIVGSVLVMIVAMGLAFPIGVASAIYLEKFAKDNKFTKFIEININNLNAVPSIIFGLLGLSVFINFFGMPRSSALVGGIVLAIMSLPVIIVSTRSALRIVPESISQAGYSLGLTKFQVIFGHVLPNAFGGILTGLIMALAGAIGETAPLMIVGMIAFVPEIATSLLNPSTVMPAQIYIWSSSPERIYIEKTSAAILVLLFTVFALNLVAIMLRNRINKKV